MEVLASAVPVMVGVLSLVTAPSAGEVMAMVGSRVSMERVWLSVAVFP